MSIRVLAPGLLTSVQDAGRFGHAALGVGSAGAMDPTALRLANALVGNDESAAGLEMTLRGPRLRFERAAVIALTGAETAARTDDGAALPAWRPVALPAGTTVDFGAMRRGARSCLAVRGGIDAERVLGSRSTDINAALGPFGGRALAQGDTLAIGASAGTGSAASHASPSARIDAPNWSLDPRPWFDAAPIATIALVRGAHADRLDAASRRALLEAEFRVGSESNRVGYRLDGTSLALAAPLELASESVVPGTIQLPPGGQPIVLMAEAPTTGGYPRIGHVASVDLPRLAQCRPGDRVRFYEIPLADAQARWLERERTLAALVRSIRERLGA